MSALLVTMIVAVSTASGGGKSSTEGSSSGKSPYQKSPEHSPNFEPTSYVPITGFEFVGKGVCVDGSG